MTFPRLFTPIPNEELARLREENAQLQQKAASARERAAYAEGLLEATRTALATAERRLESQGEELTELRALYAREKARADRFERELIDAWNRQAPAGAPRIYTADDLINGRVPRHSVPKAAATIDGGVQ